MQEYLLFDAIPGLHHLSKPIELANTIDKHSNLDRLDRKDVKVDAHLRDNYEANKVNKKLFGISANFQQDQRIKTLYPKPFQKTLQEAKKKNAEAYKETRKRFDLQLQNDDAEFQRELKEINQRLNQFEKKWSIAFNSNENNDDNVIETINDNKKHLLVSQSIVKEEEEDNDSSNEIASHYHPIEERIQEDFFLNSSASSFSNLTTDDDDEEETPAINDQFVDSDAEEK